MRLAAASTSATVGTRSARSELAKEDIEYLANRRFVHRGRMSDAGQREVDQVGFFRVHAGKRFGGEDIRHSTTDDKSGFSANRAPQIPQIGSFTPHLGLKWLCDVGVPVEMQLAVAALDEG